MHQRSFSILGMFSIRHYVQPCFACSQQGLLVQLPIMVVPSFRFECKAVAWSDVEASPYKVFVEGLPAPPKLATRKASKKNEVDHTLTAKHPWVHRIVAKHSGSSGGGHAGLPLIEEKELDEEELKAVYDAVAEAKFEIAAGHGEGGEEAAFAVEPTNNSHRGHGSRLAIDSYRGRPSPGLPSDWVNEFLPKGHRSATFSIKKYGASFAVGLCEMRSGFGSCNLGTTNGSQVVVQTTSNLHLPMCRAARRRICKPTSMPCQLRIQFACGWHLFDRCCHIGSFDSYCLVHFFARR